MMRRLHGVQDRITDPESTGLAGTVGYMGPYPLKITKGKKLTFAGAHVRLPCSLPVCSMDMAK